MSFHDALVGDLSVVSIEDNALDMSLAERRAYGESRDQALVKVIPGKTPVTFVLRPLGYTEMVAIESQAPSAKLAMCFMFGVRRIENAPTAGQVMKPGLTSPTQGDAQRCIWSDDEMGAVMHAFGMRRVFEIGGVVHARTLEGNAVGGSIFFEPLRSSLDALAASESRRAALQKSTAAETPSTPAP